MTDRRGAALGLWLAVGAAWYFSVDSIPLLPLWWEVALMACVLMPGVFLFDWIVLALARARGLLPVAAVLGLLALLAEIGDLEVLANVAKLAAVTFFAFWFLNLFEELVLLVIVALVVPFVDAYSVFRGPTGNIVEHHSNVFEYFSLYFALPHEHNDPRLGIPDLLFFALYLAAAARFGLRPGWTWLGMVAALGATIAITVWADVAGLPALPALSIGFLLPNADLIWARLRRRDGDDLRVPSPPGR
jgi:hypothetical protein